MELHKNGITVLGSDKEVERLILERLSAPEIYARPPEILLDLNHTQPVGTEWQGGTYAGIARGRDGAPDYHLIVGPEHGADIDWDAAVAWAKGLDVAGRKDLALPSRKELALCFANVAELFQERAYWSCGSAWGQHFNDGSQGYWSKSLKLRARAVRRLPI